MSSRKKNNQKKLFALCLHEDEQGESLTLHKLYPVIADPQAEPHGYIRIIDDSGEDYLYSTKFFAMVELPAEVSEAMLQNVELAV
jgi:hypothetical protein